MVDLMWQQEPGRRDPTRRPYAPTRVTRRDVTRIVWRTVGFTALVELIFFALGVRLPLPLVALLTLSAQVGARIVRAAQPPPTDPPLPRAQADPRPAGRPFADVSRLEDRLAWGGSDLDHFNSAVRPVLVRLADERLQRHGITRQSHPESARQLLGEQLWRLANDPATASTASMASTDRAARLKEPGPTPAQLAPLVERLEAL